MNDSRAERLADRRLFSPPERARCYTRQYSTQAIRLLVPLEPVQ
jgi:hypothetical protein